MSVRLQGTFRDRDKTFTSGPIWGLDGKRPAEAAGTEIPFSRESRELYAGEISYGQLSLGFRLSRERRSEAGESRITSAC